MWEKKGTIKCDKRTVTCDIGSTQCEDGTTECDKSTITYNVSTTQCKAGTIKCEKKKREPPNVTKVQSHMMLILRNVRMIP